MKKIFTLNFLRIVALIVVVVGAVASLVLMFNAGRNQKSIFLIVLFTVWVLSPFTALLVANVIARRWAIPMRVSLYLLMLFITLGSLLSYSGLLNPPRTKPAFKFLIVPPGIMAAYYNSLFNCCVTVTNGSSQKYRH